MSPDPFVPNHTMRLLWELGIFGIAPTVMLAMASFLIFMPLIRAARVIPAWVRVLLSLYPAVTAVGLAIIFPTVVTIIVGSLVGLSPLWIYLFDRYYVR